MTNYRVYFLVCYLTTLVISKPLQDDSLPHSRDYYAGYIKAITDNFDQLFATERKTRSAEDEKDTNSLEEALKKPTAGATAAESEADIKHYDGSASRLLTEKKRDVSNEETNSESVNYEDEKDDQEENERKETIRSSKKYVPFGIKRSPGSISFNENSSPNLALKHGTEKFQGNKRAKLTEISISSDSADAKAVMKPSTPGTKKKKIQNKFEEKKREKNERRHYILEHADMRSLPFFQGKIKGYKESYPGQSYEFAQYYQNNPMGFNTYNSGAMTNQGMVNQRLMNQGMFGRFMGSNLAEDMPQGLIAQDLVPTIAGITPTVDRGPRIFPGFSPQTLSPMGMNTPQSIGFNPQRFAMQQRQANPFDMNGLEKWDPNRPRLMNAGRQNNPLLMNPVMGQQNRLYMGQTNRPNTAMLLPMRQQSTFNAEDEKEEQENSEQGETRSNIKNVTKNKRRKKKSSKRCIYSKRKPVVLERIVMPSCDPSGCKLVPLQENCRNVYPVRQNLQVQRIQPQIQPQIQLPQTQIQLPQTQIQLPQTQILPVVVNQPNPVSTLTPYNARLGNTGCTSVTPINSLNNNCLYQNQEQLPTKIVMVPFYAGNTCHDNEEPTPYLQ